MTRPKRPPKAAAAPRADKAAAGQPEPVRAITAPVEEPEKPKKGLPPHLVPGNPGNSGGKKGRSGRRPNWLKELMTRLAHEKVLVEKQGKDGSITEEEVGALVFGIRAVLRSPGAKNYPAVLKTVLAYADGLPVQRVEASVAHNFAILAPAKAGSAEEWEKNFASQQLPPGDAE